MKLASWVYLPIVDLQKPAKRRAAADLIEKTGIDIALCVWSVDQILGNPDVVQALGELLAGRGAELHVGISPFSASGRVPKKHLYQYRVDGKTHYGGLCPSWPENRDRVVRNVEQVCSILRCPGLHLDFIRYLHSAGAPWKLEWEAGREWIDTYHWCQCEACRNARTIWMARSELTPYDRMHPAVTFKEFEFRKRNVEDVFRRVRAVALRHALVLSIAQRVQYLNRAITEGQDWLEWAEQGLYDFTCPMNYSTSTETFRARLKENMQRLARRAAHVKVYEGVSRKSSAGESSIETVLEQMTAAIELGGDGVTLFHLGVLQPGEHEKLRRWKRYVAS